MSLIDMEGGLGRVDGGLGLALEEPGFDITFEQQSHTRGLEGEALKLAERLCSEFGVSGVNVQINQSIPEHIGFGSKTQLFLAIAKGISQLYDIKKSNLELAKLVGRGGTSGIGVAAFDKGGFIVDGGHNSGKGFAPSSYSDAEPAPILARHDFPWWVVCAWPECQGAHGKMEKEIFERECPIQSFEVGEVSRIVLMKMLPALLEKDIDSFGSGINLLQKTGFKKVELGLNLKKIGPLLDFLQDNSPGAGMSSFGPVCYAVCESKSEANSLQKKVDSEFEYNTLATKANNSGAIIS